MLVVFEGPDGAGKSTVLNQVAEKLRAEGKTVLCTREPGCAGLGTELRNLFMDPEYYEQLGSLGRLGLLWADHLANVHLIRENYKAYNYILCDRWMSISSRAYQISSIVDPVALKAALEYMALMEDPAQEWYMIPETFVYISVDRETAQERLASRGDLNHLDTAKDHVSIRRYQTYTEMAKHHFFVPYSHLVTYDSTNLTAEEISFGVVRRLLTPAWSITTPLIVPC